MMSRLLRRYFLPCTCDGVLALDFNQYFASHPTALGQPSLAGRTIDAQAWFRDASAPTSTNMSGAIEFVVLP